MKVRYINRSGFNVGKKISPTKIYFENIIPSQLRGVFF